MPLSLKNSKNKAYQLRRKEKKRKNYRGTYEEQPEIYILRHKILKIQEIHLLSHFPA